MSASDQPNVRPVILAEIQVAMRMTCPVLSDLPTFLLDEAGGGAGFTAFAQRRLRLLYTGNLILVREDGGDTELAIGAVGEGLDEAALLAHCGSNNGFIVTRYDQGTAGNNVTISTASEQPQIVAAGVIIKENGMPVCDYTRNGTASSNGFEGVFDLTPTDGVSVASVFWVDTNASTNDRLVSLLADGEANDYSGSNEFIPFQFEGAGYDRFGSFADAGIRSYFGLTVDTQYLAFCVNDDSTITNYLNGTGATPHSVVEGLPTKFEQFTIGGQSPGGGTSWKGKDFETIIWDSDQSTPRATIQSNINAYYSIY